MGVVLWPRLTVGGLSATPARGKAGAPQLDFLSGQAGCLHKFCDFSRLGEVQQHQIIAVVHSRFSGVVLQKAQVEARVREAFADKPVLS